MVIVELHSNMNNLERDRFEAVKVGDSLKVELSQRTTLLGESKDQIKGLMVDKSSLT